MNGHRDIRIGTLVNGLEADAAAYVGAILPHGFESIQITFWQTLGGTDLGRLADGVRDAIADRDVVVSALGIYGNPLGDRPEDRETRDGWARLIDAAHLFDCPVVAGFAGRVRDEPIDASLERFGEVFGDVARRAADHGLRIAFENCAMGGDWKRGDWNIAHHPAAWEKMFDVLPDDHVGLEWEPCHQMICLVDPLPQIHAWADRIFHVHGKCANVHWDVIRKHGIHGPEPIAHHRTPGFGDCDWTDVISELRRAGYRGSIDIEGWHDPVYRDELEMTGQVHALRYLQKCRGSEFVPDPRV